MSPNFWGSRLIEEIVGPGSFCQSDDGSRIRGTKGLPAAEFRFRLGSSPEQETSDPKPRDPQTLGFWGMIPKKGVHKLLFG